MTATAQATSARIDSVDASAYQVPTRIEHESDGTLICDSTTIVVVQLHCGEHTGLGYTYCHPSAAQVIESKLAGVLTEADPLMPQKAWCEMQMQSPQMMLLASRQLYLLSRPWPPPRARRRGVPLTGEGARRRRRLAPAALRAHASAAASRSRLGYERSALLLKALPASRVARAAERPLSLPAPQPA